MKDNKEKEELEKSKAEENKNNAEKDILNEKSFLKKMWYSIVKIEKYPDMAAQGLGKAINYLCKIVIILVIVLSLGMLYQVHHMVREGVDYLEKEFPEFSYKDNVLNVDTQDILKIEDKNSVLGKVIIDTNTDNTETVNQYVNELEDVGSGVIILKDKLVLKNNAVTGTINYEYNEIFSGIGVSKFNKQDVINFANSMKIFKLYLSVFLMVCLYAFIMYLLTTLSNVIILSLFGYIATFLARIRMRYVAIFNMAVYAITLSVLLNTLYIAINIFITFDIQYFQVMYISVATIYLVAAIFILKSEIMKKQQEVQKIIEAQELIKKEMEQSKKQKDESNKEEKEQNKDKEQEKKESKKESKKDTNKENNDQEPEGSNA